MPVVRRGLPRLGPALAALALMVCAMFTPVSAHASGTGLDSVAEALKKSPVYVDPRARDQLSEADAADLAKKIEDAGKPVFVAVLPESAEFPPKTLMRDLRTQVGITGVYAVHLGDGFNANADSSVMSRNAVGNLTGAVKRSHPGDPEGLLTAFVDQATEQAKGQAPATWSGSEDDEGSGGAAVLLTVGAVAAVGGGGYALYRRSKKKRERAELDALRVVVDEDITAFGEELDRLDFHPSEPGADDVMRQDYTHALDTYDKAKELMVTAARPQDVQPVTAALEEGRFALATLAARRAGSPVPERRAPCFFDPRHGPSVIDAMWAPPHGMPRNVPACEADANLLAAGQEPMARQVQTAHGSQPYWNAGPSYAPWAGGYFGGAGSMLGGLLVGTMLGSVLSAPSAFADTAAVDSAPDGGEFTGADFNPGDFGGGFEGGGFEGGGDFGGGDW
ncbi:hypothetical protein OG369_37085 [Streptomyces sp. NBC_01221]|uniref:hypothetical protein n=1 Tax=unclassified Streptomyces TaxID=2593676 RepID=UPI00224DD55E|nr:MULTISPECIES: hypothetical protein [unclassified Streptomyces]MCX4791528.1 hypothetical protein [Streptomyces sp. NBC_01221]MCX4792769.1 hypothetical protein [Streptomyces sp. NBC_01242]WSP59715.1 hypothetical protein OG306_39365 [Streptomyces sp. NBC_01241]WSU19768.1 hypothetical protein OG508_01000 [Streptomyces sp. NBC_01108]